MSEGSWRSDRPAARGVGRAIIMGTRVSGQGRTFAWPNGKDRKQLYKGSDELDRIPLPSIVITVVLVIRSGLCSVTNECLSDPQTRRCLDVLR